MAIIWRSASRMPIALLIVLCVAVLTACGSNPPPPTATPPPVGQWLRKASMQEERSWIGMASVEGKIYAIGGMTGSLGRRLDLTEVYDPQKNTWTYLRPMPTARSSVGVVAVGTRIYAIGGFPETGVTTAVEVFDTERNQWRTGLAPMPTKRFDLTLSAIGNTIYAIGGYDLREMNIVEAYDTVGDRWSSLPPLPTARYALQSLVVNGKIWAMGGRNADGPTDMIEVFDPATRQWSPGGKLPTPLAGFGAALADDGLHIVKYDLHYRYNFQSGLWSKLPAMLTSRHGLQLTYIDGLLFAVGGCMPGDGTLFDVAKNEAFVIRAPSKR
ncbi:MAG: hypothetical protein HY259_04155 [Chloroflexi bacterium]|nr:hypothetical protein [Chloroflexota bacterium]